MADVLDFPSRPPVVAHYREIKSFTDNADESDLRVILASEDENPGVVHVMLIGQGAMEVLDSYRDTEAGRGLANIVGQAADKAVFFALISGPDEI